VSQRQFIHASARRSILGIIVAAVVYVDAWAQTPLDCPPAMQPPSAEQVRSGMRDAHDRGFLWRISKSGHSSYLYGTVHVAKLEWMFPGPAVTSALGNSDVVALELDVLDPQIQQRLTEAMTALSGDPLPEGLRRRIRRQEQAQCLPQGALDSFAPEVQLAALTTLAGRREGLNPAYGIDAFLAGWARSSSKGVVSLETPEVQIAALRMGSRAETVEFVQSALNDLESGTARTTLRRIAQVWADDDLETLSKYQAWCDCLNTAVDRAEMARLLDERNPGLAQGVAALHDSGKRVFAAVGSLHMIGPLGLPALMAQRGFSVERVEFRP
jgi:uncharacterized protein YbaP (TraB family)